MNRLTIAMLAAALAGCSTAQMLQRAPDRTYHSAKARDAVAECLMNRLAGAGDFRVHRTDAGAETQVVATGIAGTYFLFTLRDSPAGGTDGDVRRANSVAPGLNNAETCF